MTSVDKKPDGTGGGPVRPSEEDPVAAAATGFLGGPPGRYAAVYRGRLTPQLVVVLLSVGVFALGMVQKFPCYDGAWFFGAGAQYTHACYSDIPHLFHGRGFAEGLAPYFDAIPQGVSGGMEYLEYPVLTGLLMEVTSWFTPGTGTIQHREQVFWLVNAAALMACTAVAALAVARTHRSRPWDALLFALAPAFALTATINWDLLAVALAAVGMLLWSRRRPGWAGVLIGLATAAKLYPVLLLGPLLVLCLRAGRMRAFGAALGGAAASWLAVNLPVMLLAFDGWSKFYTFSQERGEDYGSIWLIVMQTRGQALEHVNVYATGTMLLMCAGIAALCLYAPRRPRFAQTAFLVVAAFVLSNKVYSPQYVLWLVPLAALARPRWRDFLVWQACEVVYFLGIWMYLAHTTSGDKNQGLPQEGYHLAIAVHLLGTLYLCAVVVRDILFPDRDPVRRGGLDDPSGGVLDGTPDRFSLHRLHAAPGAGEDDGRSGGVTTVRWGARAPRPSPALPSPALPSPVMPYAGPDDGPDRPPGR
ncbi:glycosyltransferase family 87 protein [Streptomyces sp. HB2AG]|uniref:glycosyltransferase family 87 protein n=1 Tax=Streptomyces sp. HB2AG TaxID=2983400 RepID=UPI0022AB3F70|nr:glycosyltransferase 87 family protein [Streptomyces sp. HB2AG]MCZ2527849.1 glycosyltransferase 87 family protein [Streptomyces sp. HB2AG]